MRVHFIASLALTVAALLAHGCASARGGDRAPDGSDPSTRAQPGASGPAIGGSAPPAVAGSGGPGASGSTAGVTAPGPVGGAAAPDAAPSADAIPEPPDYAIAVPPHEQPDGDPERGYDYLVNGDYQRLGPDLIGFKASAPPVPPHDQLPGRRGENADLSYMFNAVESPDGNMVAAMNCLSCHATHLRGELIVGLGRPNRMVRTSDVDAFGIALANPLGIDSSLTTLDRLLGGVSLGVMDVFPYLASHRDPKTLEWTDVQVFNPDAGVQGWVDIPPWWRTKKKNGLYSNGSGRGYQGHHMSFMSIFSVENTQEAAVIERNFYDVRAYLNSIEPPRFPGPVDMALAALGEQVFVATCATCHGTYGEDWTYPNVIIPHQEVGTDPSLATGHWMTPTVDWYAESWYAREGKSWIEITLGYYAPPLDGIWATAPFFHNGSVPTLDGVIDPDKRLAVWTSNMSEDDYDLERVGWMDKPFDGELTLDGGFGTFDTSLPGNSNRGHIYGDGLTEEDQRALLEYLKTL
jgi:cytochrome c5